MGKDINLLNWSICHMTTIPIFGTNLQRTESPIIFKLSMQLWGLKLYKVCINDDPGMTMTHFMARVNLVTMHLNGGKLLQSFNLKNLQ